MTGRFTIPTTAVAINPVTTTKPTMASTADLLYLKTNHVRVNHFANKPNTAHKTSYPCGKHEDDGINVPLVEG